LTPTTQAFPGHVDAFLLDLTMPGRATAERRIYPRHRVRVAVVWRNRQQGPMAGEICDVSTQGIFIVSTSALPDDVGVGDHTEITLSSNGRREVLAGIVRWRGFHPMHQAIGCGIQLDETSAQAIIRLFPVLRAPEPAR
jgi:hypothetical protein